MKIVLKIDQRAFENIALALSVVAGVAFAALALDAAIVEELDAYVAKRKEEGGVGAA